MIRNLRKGLWPAIVIACTPSGFLARADVRPGSAVAVTQPTPLQVVEGFLGATHARDFDAAYRYISSADRGVRDKQTYLRAEQSLSGFALELARWFAREMKVWVIEERAIQNSARLEVGYRLPSGDEVAAQLFDWDSDKLNALSQKEQTAIFEELERIKKSGKMITVEGRNAVDLVREKQGWKIFEDWQSRHRILFQALQPKPAQLEIKFLRNDLFVNAEEPFQVDLKIINRSDREMWVQVKHSFAPRPMEKNIDMIACGSLVPFRLEPRESRGISSAYILRPSVAVRTPVSITYEFSPTLGPIPKSQSFTRPQ